jgi:hypothetical protein
MVGTIALEELPASGVADLAGAAPPWPLDHWQVDVTFVDEPGFQTTARAHLTAGLDHLGTQGSARKHPADPHDADVAHVVATARAFAALSARLFAIATARIREWDDEADALMR